MSRAEDLRVLRHFHEEKSIERCVDAEKIMARNPDIAKAYERLRLTRIYFDLRLSVAISEAEKQELVE